MPNSNKVEIEPIGYLKSPFTEKFGLPRQSGLITSASSYIHFISPYDQADAFRGLEQCSHLWLIFQFHQNAYDNWKPLVRPPRLGGNEKLGVYATRSSFRPNGLGMSQVALKQVHRQGNSCYLEISCPDMVDGTPIFDIKPYLTYSDNNDRASTAWAASAPEPTLEIEFSEQSLIDLAALPEKEYPKLKALIEESLSYDPRPAYQRSREERVYGFRLWDVNIVWQVKDDRAVVMRVEKQDKR